VSLNQAPSSVSLILRNLVSFKLGKSCTTKIREVLLFLHGSLHNVFSLYLLSCSAQYQRNKVMS
jgi:hypothetical protein